MPRNSKKADLFWPRLQLLDKESELVSQSPQGSVLKGLLMLEAGRLEEAFDALRMTAEFARQQPQSMTGVEWQFPTALSQMAICDLESAYETWSAQLKELDAVKSMHEPYAASLMSLPMVADANVRVNAPFPLWPLQHISTLGGRH